MKFVAYVSSLNPKAVLDHKKSDILKKFVAGVNASGDNGLLYTANSVLDADVAMIVGWVHENSKQSRHLQLRKQIYDHQLARNKKILLADSNLFLYKNTDNPEYYIRYSFNGVFPNTGIYCDSNPDPSRWKSISKNIGVSLKEYRTTGDHILLCLQRNGGWSMDGYDVLDWARKTITEIRKHTDRTIILRGHPGDKGTRDYLRPQVLLKKIGMLKNVRLSTNPNFLNDLRNCWAVVNHNSSPTVGAAIEGFPVFVTDPQRSQCYDIANTDLSKIENPNLPDRQPWVERISMFHWNFKEIETGECWRHMKQYV